MKLQLWLEHETEDARLFLRAKPGTQIAHSEVWIPKSVCRTTTKFPPEPGIWQARCEVEVADWFVEKQNLGTSAVE